MFCGQLAVNCLGIKVVWSETEPILVMFLNSCPWNRYTLAWRGVYCRLRIRQDTKVNTCVQAVTHAAFTIRVHVCANCRHFTCISFLYDFGTYIYY